MLKRRIFGLSMLATLFLAGAVMAADATGTWTWTQAGRGGGGGGGGGGGAAPATPAAPNVTLKLKQDGEKLTGTIALPAGGRGGRGGRRGGGGGGGGGGAAPAPGADGAPPASAPAPTPIDIKDGKVSGSDVTFSIERPGRGGGAPTTVKYTLKLDGDSLKGKSEFEGPNGAVSTDINATRSKE